MKKKVKSRQYYKESVACHLCGLPIPSWIVAASHPLYGTVDHVQPRSLGGTNRAENRSPAHRCCNNLRGTREIDSNLRTECLAVAIASFCDVHEMPRTAKWKHVREVVRRKKKNDRKRASGEINKQN